MTASCDALVIGGGPAGAALALRLARAGRRVVLLERTRGPHDKVCGDFLSVEAGDELDDLGVDLSALGARRLSGMRLTCGLRDASSPLPFPAYSLSRRRLDEALLQAAARAGAGVRRGRRVTLLERQGDAWAAGLEDGERWRGDAAFLAVGKHDLKGWRRLDGLHNDLVGFKLYWRLAPGQQAALEGQVELHLFPHGYAGLEAVEAGRANLCLVVRASAFRRCGGQWKSLLAAVLDAAPALARRLEGGRPSTAKPLAIARLPYGYLASPEGLWRLGDQAAVVPSFAGDGVAIALHSARRAADAWTGGLSAEQYQRELKAELGGRIRRAAWLSLALVRPSAQPMLVWAACAAPGLIAAVAGATRIDPQARAVCWSPHGRAA